MSDITDAQAEAATNAHADEDAVTAGSVQTPVGSDVVSSPTFVSGTAKQLSATNEVDLYINPTDGTDALAVAMGPTSSVAHAIVASEAVTKGLLTLRVPAGWYVKLTGTIADYAITAVAHESVA